MTPTFDLLKPCAEGFVTAAIVDVETTGLDYRTDCIIELAVRRLRFHGESGHIAEMENPHSWLQDPGSPLPAVISSLTGITDGDLQGKKIDWNDVDELLQSTDLIIAHNARFDRPFIDAKSMASRTKIWGCSVVHIDWRAKGLESAALAKLCEHFKISTRAHRAGDDIEAVLSILSLQNAATAKPHLAELYSNVCLPSIHVEATGAPFAVKDALKGRRYRWNPQARVWWKVVGQNEWPTERLWLEKEVYKGAFAGSETIIQPEERFRAHPFLEMTVAKI